LATLLNVVPWSQVRHWQCLGCGECCRLQVQLTTGEWLGLGQTYGHGLIGEGVDGFYIRKTVEDWCPFLYRQVADRYCSLQRTKPLACRLWPFRMSNQPTHGNEEAARFPYRNGIYYVYLVPFCRGISYGRPTEFFAKRVVPEFLDMRLGLRREQDFSTRKLNGLW